jgi:septal ring-binding cell division protein DamX|tara:strand:+ start:267 stop:890 length:624 start_codon:yes stop_codon:yes gene_type:complete
LFKLFGAAALLAVVLSGCSSTTGPINKAPETASRSWYCADNASSDELWLCSKNPVNDGQPAAVNAPVVKVPAAQLKAPAAKLTAPAARSKALAAKSKAPAAKLTAPAASNKVPAAPIKTPHPLSGYLVQLGAFSALQVAEQQAQQIAQELNLGSDVQVTEITSQGTAFWVVFLGHYQNRAAADVAAKKLGINYWVRSMRSLANAAAQ